MNRRSFLKFGAKAAVGAPIALVACSAPPSQLPSTKVADLTPLMSRNYETSIRSTPPPSLTVDDIEYVRHIQNMIKFQDGDYISPGYKGTYFAEGLKTWSLE